MQNSIDFKGQKFYVGLDVHKKSWYVTVRSLERQVAHFTQPPSSYMRVIFLLQTNRRKTKQIFTIVVPLQINWSVKAFMVSIF